MNTKTSEVWREETLTEIKGKEAIIPCETEEVKQAAPPLEKKAESEQKERTSEGNSGVLRRYTAEEDQLILEWWHDKKVRPQLAERLHRPLGGLAYRFYQILKARGIEPSEYRREMRALKRTQQGSVQEVLLRLESKGKGKSGGKQEELEIFWTPEREMNLWRWRRAGLSWEEIAARLLGATPWECKARYEELERLQSSRDEVGREPTGARKERPGEDILDVLKGFPDQARRLEERLRMVEDDLKNLKERHRIQLEDLVAGLTKLSQVVAERDRLHQELEDARRELERLREERAKERQQLEAERQELRAVYDDLNTVLGEFMQLSSMDKLRVLGDFAARLEVTVDRFGNVVRTRRCV